jgi:hypothetical protein
MQLRVGRFNAGRHIRVSVIKFTGHECQEFVLAISSVDDIGSLNVGECCIRYNQYNYELPQQLLRLTGILNRCVFEMMKAA